MEYFDPEACLGVPFVRPGMRMETASLGKQAMRTEGGRSWLNIMTIRGEKTDLASKIGTVFQNDPLRCSRRLQLIYILIILTR